MTITSAVARGIALLLGSFSLLNAIGGLRHPRLDANLWWIDLRFTASWAGRLVIVVAGCCLLMFGWQPTIAPFHRRIFRGCLGFLMIVAAYNAWMFRSLVHAGVIRSGFPFPLSLVTLFALALVFVVASREGTLEMRGQLQRWICCATIIVGAILFPLAQMYCFGKTDYRREADVIVVFGCLVHSDGTPSLALSDRVRTGVELYQAGFAPRIIFSGGPGTGPTHETYAMRNFAVELGVPLADIDLDLEGLNTHATVTNLVSRDWGTDRPRVLAVSHFYHLPRVKLSFRRAGWDVFTVPAHETRPLYYLPRYLMREVLALWWYYLNPI